MLVLPALARRREPKPEMLQARARQEELLDATLEASFPASDPPTSNLFDVRSAADD